MNLCKWVRSAVTATAVGVSCLSAFAADPPAVAEGDWVAKDFRFHAGEVLPELKLHYTSPVGPRKV
jgi:homoserine O-acetyltransferase